MAESAGCTGEYLCFSLGEEQFAVKVYRVEVVLGMQYVTRVPKTSPHMRGGIKHRGSVVPVLDLKMRFGMGPFELTEGTSIIILQIEYCGGLLTVGMLAEGRREVVNLIPAVTLEAIPQPGTDR